MPPEKCDVIGCGLAVATETKSGRKLCSDHAIQRHRYATMCGGWGDDLYRKALEEWESLNDRKEGSRA